MQVIHRDLKPENFLLATIEKDAAIKVCVCLSVRVCACACAVFASSTLDLMPVLGMFIARS